MFEAKGVSVRLGGRLIVEAADLALSPGRVTVLIGPNGAGKSTLLRALAGEHRLAAGRISIHGLDIAMLKPAALARWRAVLGQSVSPTTAFTVEEVVRLGLPATIRNTEADALVARGLGAVALSSDAPRPITHLSGGEQQRVHAARVLVQLWAQPDDGRARYLLLDEPTSHLDPAHQVLLAGLAREHAKVGGGLLAVLHDLNLAAAVADEIAVLHRGRIVARGTPAATLTETLLREVYGIGFRVTHGSEALWVVPDYRGRSTAEESG